MTGSCCGRQAPGRDGLPAEGRHGAPAPAAGQAPAVSAPAVLLPYQQRFLADLSPVRLWEKSRRIGASWGVAAEASLIAAAEVDGMDVWYIGYNREMAQEFIRDSANWAKHYQLAAEEVDEIVLADPDGDIAAFRITFAGGHRITALSSRPTGLRGKQGLVVIDEAAFHDDLPGLIKAAMALLMWGGRVVVISTHFGVENHFNEIISEIRAGKKPYSLHRTTLDDALAEGLYQRICLATKRTWSPEAEAAWRNELVNFYGDAADEELFCIPSQSGGFYLSRALVEARMVAAPVLRQKYEAGYEFLPEHIRVAEVRDWLEAHLKPLLQALDPSCRSYYGMDFGRTGDRSVIVPLTEDRGLNRAIPFVVELGNAPHKVQEQVLFYIVERLPRFSHGANDAGGNGSYLAEVAAQRFGSARVSQIKLSQEWYRENMPKYKAALEDGILTMPKDEDLLSDHRTIVVDKGVPKVPDRARTKGSDGGQRHGDAAIACVLAWFAQGQGGGPIEFEALGQPRVGAMLSDYVGG